MPAGATLRTRANGAPMRQGPGESLVAEPVRLRPRGVGIVRPAILRIKTSLDGLVLDMALGVGHEAEIIGPSASARARGHIRIDGRPAALVDFRLNDLGVRSWARRLGEETWRGVDRAGPRQEPEVEENRGDPHNAGCGPCLLYTSDAADEEDSVDLGGRRIIKKKK